MVRRSSLRSTIETTHIAARSFGTPISQQIARSENGIWQKSIPGRRRAMACIGEINRQRRLTGDQAPIGENLQDTDQHEFAEYRQIAHERNFFARNPQLASEAKERDDYTCQICSFNFTAAYGELGKGLRGVSPPESVIRARRAASDKAMTHVDDVTTLCANCHRMVHRTRPR